ncbi:UbiA family prenyltransferase [Nocardioides sp. SYSU D00038]|uniref:UbiA family prenyltransferase n=1 Tax=Nocardioides sp. SYSU D00038 TaxID=2812554 RepID=UPI0019683D27|nr:UbiA family prenyltransferase [Nocardioides sp. SYSU D00038]
MTLQVVGRRQVATGLVAASHPGPAVAVTAVAILLAGPADRGTGTAALVGLAVLAGQLTVGWVNDLVDVARDRTVGRSDKPIATGAVPAGLVRAGVAVAAAVCVVASLALGWRSALVHAGCLGAAHAYNLGLKATLVSWLPYAVAFGLLPSVVWLAGPSGQVAPWWAAAAGATLGVGAHLVNAVPDLADDARTGVRGLPHLLGETAARRLATVLLGAASLLAALGPEGSPPGWCWVALVVVAVLAAVALVGSGRTPFRAAMAVALLDVVLLVGAG